DPEEDILRDGGGRLEDLRGRDVVARNLNRGHVECGADRAAAGLQEFRLEAELQQSLCVARREPPEVHRRGEDELALAKIISALAFEEEGDGVAQLVHGISRSGAMKPSGPR